MGGWVGGGGWGGGSFDFERSTLSYGTPTTDLSDFTMCTEQTVTIEKAYLFYFVEGEILEGIVDEPNDLYMIVHCSTMQHRHQLLKTIAIITIF